MPSLFFPIGNQRVGIVTATAGTDKTELFETEQDGDTVAWVDNCLFEIQQPAEAQDIETTTVFETAFCFMPVADGVIPTIDGVGKTVAEVKSTLVIRYPYPDGADYVMRGDAVLEEDIRGRQSHVFAKCERQLG